METEHYTRAVSTDKARVDEKMKKGIGVWECRKTPDSRGVPVAKLARLEGEESKVTPCFKSLKDMVNGSAVKTWRMIYRRLF